MTEEQRIKRNARCKRWYQNNKQVAKDRATKWNKENKEDRKAITLKSWHKNKIKNKDKIKNQMLKFDHGITLEQFNEMLKVQDNKCAICELVFNNDSKVTKPHVDHCHVTNKIRALLCHPCNIGIGVFKDNPSLLIKAAEYLRK